MAKMAVFLKSNRVQADPDPELECISLFSDGIPKLTQRNGWIHCKVIVARFGTFDGVGVGVSVGFGFGVSVFLSSSGC